MKAGWSRLWVIKTSGSLSADGLKASRLGEGFVREVKGKLGPKSMWREVAGATGSYELREPASAYKAVFEAQNGDLRGENALFWDRYR